MSDAAVLLVCAADGEPLVQTGRQAAARHAGELVRAARARAGARRLIVAIERRAEDAAAALGTLLRADELLIVDDVAGCGEAAFLRARVAADVADVADVAGGAGGAGSAGAADVAGVAGVADVAGVAGVAGACEIVHAADLVSSGDRRLVTVAGAVVAPRVRHVAASATIEDVVAGAGGAVCGPGWVALRSTLVLRSPLDPDVRIGDVPGLRAVIVAPGGSTLARRARGDLRAPDPTTPLGVDRAWLGAFDANLAASAGEAALRVPLSLALVARRLGFVPDSLAWPPLDPDALPA